MITVVVVLLLSAFGAKPNRWVSRWVHRFAFIIFGLLAIGNIILTTAYIWVYGDLYLKIMLSVSFSTYFVVGLIHGEIQHVFWTLPVYLFALPSFINIFQIHSMCNLHDVSWGTRPEATTTETTARNMATHGTISSVQNSALLDACYSLNEDTNTNTVLGVAQEVDSSCNAEEQQIVQHNFMLGIVFAWMFTNMSLVVATRYILSNQAFFMDASMTLLFAIMVIRFVGSTLYAVGRYCCCCYGCCRSPWFEFDYCYGNTKASGMNGSINSTPNPEENNVRQYGSI
jgi:hypothetical protein